jgi:phosphoglycerol transferase
MQSNIGDYLYSDAVRSTYNVFINSRLSTENNLNRTFTSFDMFPTTLASLGVTIEGDRLGLGTNLFSDKETLAEELGLTYINEELSKKSEYYNLKFLKETYYEMLVENSE